MSTRTTIFAPEFVDSVPGAEAMSPGTLYVSMKYALASHKCACGCGLEVVTPLSRTDWSLYFDGESISLHPSIGNWSFPCQSHYWIRRNAVEWAPKWSRARIEAQRQADLARRHRGFGEEQQLDQTEHRRRGIWAVLHRWFRNPYGH